MAYRRGKPDELHRFGPLTVARFGRAIVFDARWEPKEFAEWKDSWPALKDEADKLVATASAEIVAFAKRVAPDDVLATLFTRFGLTDPTTYVESKTTSGEHFSEYYASVVAALPEQELGTQPMTDDDFETLVGHMKSLFKAALDSVHRGTDPADKETYPEFRVQLMTRKLLIRGESYPEHHRSLFAELVQPHDAYLKSQYGFGAQELLRTLNAIEKLFDRRIASIADGWKLLAEAQLSDQSELTEDQRQRVDRAFLSPDEFLRVPEDAEGIDKDVLDRISLAPGGNAEFIGGQRGDPMFESKVNSRPLLKLGGKFLCPSPILLFRSYFPIANELLRGSKNFTDKRGELLEELAVRHLKAIFPSAEVHRSLFYTVDGNRCETDAMLLFDRHLLIVEAKAGGVHPATMRGAPKKLKKDFEELIDKAFEQGTRVRRYLSENPSATFVNARGEAVLNVEKNSYDELFIVAPTLSVLDPVGSQLGAARKFGLLSDGDLWPWCVFVNDLRVIAELVRSPAEFVLYLKRRLAAHETPLAPHDELDLFCKFLSDGLLTEKDEFKGLSRVLVGGFSDMLDRWYIGGPFDAQIPKPILPVPSNVRRLIDAVESTSMERRTEVGRLLLELWSDFFEELDEFLGQYPSGALGPSEHHDLSISARQLSLGLTIFLSTKGRLTESLVSHARKRRHMSSFSRWLAVSFSPDSGHCEFVFVGAEELSSSERAEVRHRRRQLIEQYVETHGALPGRNETCPCLSSSKYKRCCGASFRAS